MDTQIEIVTFSSLVPGPKVLVLGSVHGSEPCGYHAITKIIQEIRTGKKKLLYGSVTFVPICNKLAFKKKTAYIEENLNRVFTKHIVADTNEKKLANILTELVDNNDILLDIHSITSQGKPFVFLDYPDQLSLAEIIGPQNAVSGWTEAYAEQSSHSWDSIKYAHTKGKESILVECGKHSDKNAKKVAYDAINNLLIFKKMFFSRPKKQKQLTIIELKKIYFKKHAHSTFCKKWKHLEFIKKGTKITNGEESYCASDNCYILLPSPQATAGEEWFYLGTKK